jgi:hypothetical protein
MNLKSLLKKQNYSYRDLLNTLDKLQDKNNVEVKYEIIVDIFDDEIYDLMTDLLYCINEEYIENIYGKYTSFVTIYNNIIICIEDDDMYCNLIFRYDEKKIKNNDLELLCDVFKFLYK